MVPAPELRAPSEFEAPRRRHSVKPDVAYEIVSQVSPGPRAELFAREPRPGWWVWGNEVPTDDEVWPASGYVGREPIGQAPQDRPSGAIQEALPW